MYRFGCGLALGLSIVLSSTPVAAQVESAALVGEVRSPSGPEAEVQVVISSPVLIEGSKTVRTNTDGRYRVVDLLPGVYTVEFRKEGFGILRHVGIELSGAFVATLNTELQAGAGERTVSGGASQVDTQNVVGQNVTGREKMEEQPTGRNVFAVGQKEAGKTTNRPDVGGSEGMQQTSLQSNGSETRDITYHVDGLEVSSNFGTGSAVGIYYNQGMVEQTLYQTSAIPAEISEGGVRVNMITKSGGNVFRGSVFATTSTEGLQANNLDDRLRALGLTAPNKVKRVYDINPSLGGPIRRDRLWFFTTFRRWGVDNYVAETFNPDRTQAVDDNRITSTVVKLTYAMNRSNRLSGFYDHNIKYRGHRRDLSSDYQFVDPVASYVQTTPRGYMGDVKWNSTPSDKLVLEAGFSKFYLHYKTGYQPGVPSDAIAQVDFVRSTLSTAAVRDYDSYADRRTFAAAATYLVGQHTIRFGVQYSAGPYRETEVRNGDRVDRFRNGVPDAVQTWNSPIDVRESMVETGLFVQDSWTLNRLTANVGVRYETFKAKVKEQTVDAGLFVPARSFAEIPDVPNWRNAVPRLGVSYDLFGNARTALKASASKYMQNEGVGLAHTVNPMFASNDTRSWTDRNGDRVSQLDELGPSTGFRGGVNQRIDPDLERPFNWEYAIGVQHDLGNSFNVGVSYVHRSIRRLYGKKNLLVGPSQYTAVTITNPLTNEPLTVYNQHPATRSLVDFVVSNYDELNKDYNGVEFKGEKRFGTRASLFAGLVVGAKKGSIRGTNDDLNNPNILINHIGYTDLDSTYQGRISGSYQLPWNLAFSGSWLYNTGAALRRILTVNRTLVPDLTQVNQPVDVLSRGEVRAEAHKQLDFRFSRSFTAGGTRFEAVADMYNILNGNNPINQVENVGSRLDRPSLILNGRLVRLGMKLSF